MADSPTKRWFSIFIFFQQDHFFIKHTKHSSFGDQNENKVKTTQTIEVARDLPKNYLSQDLQKSNHEASAYLQLLSKICARV